MFCSVLCCFVLYCFALFMKIVPNKSMSQTIFDLIEWIKKWITYPSLGIGKGGQVNPTSKSLLSLTAPDGSWSPKFIAGTFPSMQDVLLEQSGAWPGSYTFIQLWCLNAFKEQHGLLSVNCELFRNADMAACNDYCSCFPLKFHVRLLNRALLIWKKGVGEEPYL